MNVVDFSAWLEYLVDGGWSTRPKLLASQLFPMTRVASAAATEIITDVLCDNNAREKSFGVHSFLANPWF